MISGAWTHQVVEGCALLPVAHVHEEAMVRHQQERTCVLQVILDQPLRSEHRLLDSTVVRTQLTGLCCQTVIDFVVLSASCSWSNCATYCGLYHAPDPQT